VRAAAADAFVARALTGDPVLLPAALRPLDDDALCAIEDAARARLERLPSRAYVDEDTAELRRRLRRVAAEAAAHRGALGPLIAELLLDWRDGRESAARLVELLIADGRLDYAAVVARMALRDDDCPQRARIGASLARLEAASDGWRDALAAFVASPTVDAWRRLVATTPGENLLRRTRRAIPAVLAEGVDADAVFTCATTWGLVDDAVALVNRGLVEPATIERRAREAPAATRDAWWDLAARAARILRRRERPRLAG